MAPTNSSSALKIQQEQIQVREFLKVISPETDENLKELTLDSEALDTESKVELISAHFAEIMRILGLDLADDSLKATPKRVAKMYVNEVFSGLNPENKPSVTLFENNYNYEEMLLEKNIKVHSFCEHHFVPIIGKAHVAYISNGKVIGLSKINRIVDFFARRPQVQERLTVQIAEELKKVLQTEDVAVAITADHMCVTLRGIKDQDSSTYTSSFHGKFKEREFRQEFLDQIKSGK
jgi:GTP cyclohydrolase I